MGLIATEQALAAELKEIALIGGSDQQVVWKAARLRALRQPVVHPRPIHRRGSSEADLTTIDDPVGALSLEPIEHVVRRGEQHTNIAHLSTPKVFDVLRYQPMDSHDASGSSEPPVSWLHCTFWS